MAGHFSNTQYNNTVDSLLGTMQKAINNNYYKYSDKPPTPVEYFHINKEASTLDDGSRLAFNNVGEDSPLYYNRVENMILYGVETPMAIQYTSEEFGMESTPIEGDCIILPNTIEPFPDDQFIITYTQQKLIFKVTHVEPDTLENGSNIYKVSYRSSTSSRTQLLKQVVDNYEFLISNVGTELNPIIKSSTAVYIKHLDESLIKLKMLFKRLFYNKRVQTFTYRYLEKNFYDPYMIEFIRKHNILDGDGEYIYIQHQTSLEPMFPVIYGKTIFNCLEKKDYSHIEGYTHRGAAKLIENKFTIFINRMEEYWEVQYDYPQDYEFLHQIPCFKDQFISHIVDGELLEREYTFYNIIIKYLYDNDIVESDIESLDKICYENNPTLFYAIPCIIFCLEDCLNKLLLVK